MLSAMHCLEYLPDLQLNLSCYYDVDHGTNRNVWNAISDLGLKPMMRLVMMLNNLPSMPGDSDLRLRQMRDLLSEHYQLVTLELSPLFQYLSADMHRDRRPDLAVEEGQTKDQALWVLLRADSHFKVKGDRCCIARFCVVVGASRRLLATWSCKKFELSVGAIESGMLEKKHLPKIAFKASGGDESSVTEAGTTSRSVVPNIDSTLRSCGENGLVISLALVGDNLNRRHLAIVVHAGEVAMR